MSAAHTHAHAHARTHVWCAKTQHLASLSGLRPSYPEVIVLSCTATQSRLLIGRRTIMRFHVSCSSFQSDAGLIRRNLAIPVTLPTREQKTSTVRAVVIQKNKQTKKVVSKGPEAAEHPTKRPKRKYLVASRFVKILKTFVHVALLLFSSVSTW